MTTQSENQSIPAILSAAAALAALPPEARLALGNRLYPQHFDPGETIIRQGNIDKDLYLLGTGEANVTMTDRDGREIEIGRLRAGDVFGEWSLLTNRPRAASVRATTRIEAYILHKEDYDIVLDNYLSLVRYLIRALSIRQREYAGQLAAELNLWASKFGGMQKDQILSVAFLSVAASPSTPLPVLAAAARFRLWTRDLETIVRQGHKEGTAIQTAIQESIALVRGEPFRAEQALTGALRSILDELSMYPAYESWHVSWLKQLDHALTTCLNASHQDGTDISSVNRILGVASLTIFHIVIESTVPATLIDHYMSLDHKAGETTDAAYQLHLAVSQIRRAQRKPGYPTPDAGAREGRRKGEKQLRELERMARDFPKTARISADAVVTITRLLTEYFLRIDELRPRSAALPSNI